LERKQVRRGEVKGMEGSYRRSSETGAKTDVAMTIRGGNHLLSR